MKHITNSLSVIAIGNVIKNCKKLCYTQLCEKRSERKEREKERQIHATRKQVFAGTMILTQILASCAVNRTDKKCNVNISVVYNAIRNALDWVKL